MKKILILTLLVLIFNIGVDLFISLLEEKNFYNDTNFLLIIFTSDFVLLLHLVPYYILGFGLWKQNIYNLGNYFKWFIVAVLVLTGNMIFQVFMISTNEIIMLLAIIIGPYMGQWFWNNSQYFIFLINSLPLLILCIAFIRNRTKYKFMSNVSIVSILLILFFPLLIFVTALLIDVYRRK